MAKVTKSYDGLKTLFVQEQYLSTCPKGMAMRLKEGKPETNSQLAEIAKNYIEAHASDIVFGIDPKHRKIHSLQIDAPRCTNCGRVGHLKHQCFRKESVDKTSPPRKSPSPKFPRMPHSPQKQQRQSPPRRPPPPKCFLCGKVGHLARNCLVRKTTAAAELQHQGRSKDYQEEAGTCLCRKKSPTPDTKQELKCPAHHRVKCPECLNISPTKHYCQALIAVCQECRQCHPVAADACLSQDKCRKMPVKKKMVEGKLLNVLWDTGCSAVVVHRSLVPDNKLTGVKEQCVLIDGTVRQTPVAKIHVETPYFTGENTAICMKEKLFDLIIGNLRGVHRAHGRASAGFGSASYRRQGYRAASDFGGHSWRTNGYRRQE